MNWVVLIDTKVLALLARLIVNHLKSNGVREKIEIIRGCPENGNLKAVGFVATHNREVLCCLSYTLQHPRTNLRDDVLVFQVKPYLEKKYPGVVASFEKLSKSLGFNLDLPRFPGSFSHD